jgi:hypothetical protein
VKFLIILGLLLFKHIVLTNLVDAGYSTARRQANLAFTMALIKHTVCEALLSIFVLYRESWTVVISFLTWEMTLQAVSCFIERRAPVLQLLRYHLICETALVLSYAALLWVILV